MANFWQLQEATLMHHIVDDACRLAALGKAASPMGLPKGPSSFFFFLIKKKYIFYLFEIIIINGYHNI